MQADDFARLRMFLEAHFGDVSSPRRQVARGDEDELLVMDVTVDGVIARVDLISMVRKLLRTRGPLMIDNGHKKVDAEVEDLRRRVEAVVEMALATMQPLSRAFVGQGLEQVKGEEVLA